MSKKISQLDPGAPLASTDTVVIARGAGNVKGTLSDVSDFVKAQISSGNLTVGGNTTTKGLILGRTATAVSGVFGENESIVGVTDTTVPRTITLATAAVVEGKLLDIKDESGAAATNNIIIDTEGSETIDGLVSISITKNFGAVRLYVNGPNWSSLNPETAGGLQVGDYIATEEIALADGKVLLPADGTIPSAGTFPILNALLPNVDKLTNISSIDQTINRSLAVQADGFKGWAGKATTPTSITEYDFINLIATVVFTPTTFGNTIYSMCCSDAGDKIYALAANTTTKIVAVLRSLDNGTSWLEEDITGVLGVAPFQLAVTTSTDFARIQCDSSGSNLRAIISVNNTDGARVYSSSDSGANWVEILTPAPTFTNPFISALTSFISRDLSTIGLMSSSLTSQQYLSVGGGAFVDKNATLPRLLNPFDKMAVSADGNSVLLFCADTFSVHNLHLSVDNMSTWTLIEAILHDKEGSASSTIMSCQFHPTNVDLIYIVSIEASTTFNGRISRLTISSKTSKFIGRWNEGKTGVHFEQAAQIQSDIKLNGTSVMLSNSDPADKDFVMSNIIENDKFMADATNEALTFKIVADAP